MEDKKRICELLLPVLKETRVGGWIKNLEYIPDGPLGDEYVAVTFTNMHFTKKISVSGDSGIAMIRDIARELM